MAHVHGQAPEGVEFFERNIRPVLAEHCYSCHSSGAEKVKGGLLLDTVAGIQKGGDSGPLTKPGDAEGSLLIQAISYATDDLAMPPKAKLAQNIIDDFKKWVDMGSPLPKAEAATAHQSSIDDVAKAREFWSFQPAREQPIPKVSKSEWPQLKIDYFVLHKLDEQKMSPAPAADKRTLLRRVYFDLVGLSPTPEQLKSFEEDASSNALAKVVDNLLASPAYGEKWARHWLDVVRYAEDNPTSEKTSPPPRFPFRYRDWIIQALNEDLPYDDFVRRQLAADLMPGTPRKDLAALGFLGLAPVYHKEPKTSKDVISTFVADEWDERVDAVTRGIMGLTVACARCHDHKFDPVSAEDYYALAGVMASTQLVERPLEEATEAESEALTRVKLTKIDYELRLDYAREMSKTAKSEGKDAGPFEEQAREFKEVLKKLEEEEKQLFKGAIANAVRDAGTWVNGTNPAWTVIDYKPDEMRNLPIFIRGSVSRVSEHEVPRRFLTLFSDGKPEPFRNGSGRLELANAMVGGDASGLSGRVIVNRVWGWLFGRHLVTTPSNFGKLGDAPTHPALLDDLTARFIANGWSLKWLLREMVLSATYQQSSAHNETYAKQDQDNQWLWRMHRKRIEAEGWRDSMLQVSDQLEMKMGGPSEDLDRGNSQRRAVYGRTSRQRPPDLHRLFDLPEPKLHGEKRELTTTPLQQLYFLNSPFIRRTAESLAKRALKEASEPEKIVSFLYQQTLLRQPRAEEVAKAIELVKSPNDNSEPDWELFAQVLLTSNEFLYLN
ncbi:MAG: PSD1 and planctomycete cytochrome C domain-containing protein [Verrucomicrobiales bacterium]